MMAMINPGVWDQKLKLSPASSRHGAGDSIGGGVKSGYAKW